MGGPRLTLAKLVHQEQWLSGFILFYFSTGHLCLSSDDLSCKHHYNLEFQGRGVLAWNGEQVDQFWPGRHQHTSVVFCLVLESVFTSRHLISSCAILGHAIFLALVTSLHSAPHLFPVCVCICVCACACVHVRVCTAYVHACTHAFVGVFSDLFTAR